MILVKQELALYLGSLVLELHLFPVTKHRRIRYLSGFLAAKNGGHRGLAIYSFGSYRGYLYKVHDRKQAISFLAKGLRLVSEASVFLFYLLVLGRRTLSRGHRDYLLTKVGNLIKVVGRKSGNLVLQVSNLLYAVAQDLLYNFGIVLDLTD